MEPAVRTVTVSGYYGFGNSGDEAVLHAIITALKEEAKAAGISLRMIVLSGNPEETMRLHGVEAVHRMRPAALFGALWRSDALISGGGSLLQDATSAKSMMYYLSVLRLAQLLRVPTYIYAQGIGPIRRRERFGPQIRRCFEACRYISVRDPGSKELLVEFGLAPERIHIVPDPVMGLSAAQGQENPVQEPDGGLQQSESDSHPLRIGVSVRFWRGDRRELEGIAEGLAAALQSLPKAQLELLPFHLPQDKQASDALAERLIARGVSGARIGRHPGSDHPRDMLKAVAGCGMLVGMRLHSLIYAAAAGVPPIAVSYDPKVDAFMRLLNEAPVGSTDDLRPAALAEAVMRTARLGKNVWYREKRGLIGQMRQNSRIPAQQIISGMRI